MTEKRSPYFLFLYSFSSSESSISIQKKSKTLPLNAILYTIVALLFFLETKITFWNSKEESLTVSPAKRLSRNHSIYIHIHYTSKAHNIRFISCLCTYASRPKNGSWPRMQCTPIYFIMFILGVFFICSSVNWYLFY